MKEVDRERLGDGHGPDLISDRAWQLRYEALVRVSDSARHTWLFTIFSTSTLGLIVKLPPDWLQNVTLLGAEVPRYVACLHLSLLIVGSMFITLHSLRRGKEILRSLNGRPGELAAATSSGIFFRHVRADPSGLWITRPFLNFNVTALFFTYVLSTLTVVFLMVLGSVEPRKLPESTANALFAIAAIPWLASWILSYELRLEHKEIDKLLTKNESETRTSA